MNCKAVQDRLSLYLDGELSADEIKLVAEHVEVCKACQAELSSLEETVKLVRSLEPVEVPPDLKDIIMERVKTFGGSSVVATRWQRAWRQWGRSLSSAAAILIAAVLIGKAVTGLGYGLNKSFSSATDMAPQELDAGAPQTMAAPSMEEQEQAGPRLMTKAMPPSETTTMIQNRGQAKDAVQVLPTERKVIQTAHLVLQIEKLDTAMELLQEAVKECEGFVQSSNMFRHDSGRSAHYTLRIPVNRFGNVLTQLEKLGDVQEKGIAGQDVTEEYVDADARRRNLVRQEERLLAILDQAKTVEDILKVEGQLERVRGEIEALVGRLRYLDNQVELSTVNVELRERPRSVTVVQLSDEKGLGARLAQALTSSINLLISFTSNAVVGIVAALPFLMVAGGAAAVVWWFWCRRVKGKSR